MAHFKTRAIHTGNQADETLSRGVAIYPTAAYEFRDCEHAAELFKLNSDGHIYTRLSNPTTSRYEDKVNALYGGVGAVATSSGMAAILVAITTIAKAGDNIVTSPYLYGGTFNVFKHTLKDLGINVKFAKSDSIEDISNEIDHHTKAVFVESMSNPGCRVPDLSGLANLAHIYKIPLIVDNTFGACGYLCNPLQWGADIIVDSATKWINGHGNAMGGVIVDGGKFDWASGPFEDLTQPSEAYHGLNFYEKFGNKAFIIKCRAGGLRDLGCNPSPFDTFLMMLGLETLALRVDHIASITEVLNTYFKTQPWVREVQSAQTVSPESAINFAKYFDSKSMVLSIVLSGNEETTSKLVESLKLSKHMTMIGDSVTSVTHPASTTHKQLSEEDKVATGILPTLLRISPGLEHVTDIIEDYEQAINNIKPTEAVK